MSYIIRSIFEDQTAARLNSADKILFPITLCDLKKVLATESEQNNLCYRIQINIHFEGPEKTENDISCILLTFSCLVPMLSVLQMYNN